jgi:type I restriction enzyme M protein
LLERIGPDEFERAFSRGFFTGYDNDRTMVRIGWMNMILHGIENPAIERRDTLGKGLPDAESRAYRYVMANPPFTGTIDKADLHETRFPAKPGSTSEAVTNKSELLFVWLMLDLLQIGGRAAVIVPEGVLFGSTGAHRELRRQLLFENRLEGVISLPAGAFQPYTGVKTSILVFQKYAELPANRDPRTDSVWFYEIEADGYTMDAKRNDLPEPNDVWDVLAKWPDRVVDNRDYYQPRLRNVRWRVVDDECLKVFPELANEKGQALGIDERKTGLPADPQQATQIVVETQAPIIRDLYDAYIRSGTGEAKEAYAKAKSQAQKERAARCKLDARLNWLNRQFGDASKKLLEKADYSDRFGNKALGPVLDNVRELATIAIDDVLAGIDMGPTDASQGEIPEIPASGKGETPDDEVASSTANDANAWQDQVESIVKDFAKLDGYDVKLRSFDVQRQAAILRESKSWSAPTRAYARFDSLQWSRCDTRTTYKGSHDEQGKVRAEYLAVLRDEHNIFGADATVKKEFLYLLDPLCCEANDLNLSAGRYKPFTLDAGDHDPPTQIIAELQEIETEIQAGLAALLAMVENSA